MDERVKKLLPLLRLRQVCSDSTASPPESKIDSGPSEFRCLLTPCPTRWPPPSCLRSKQWSKLHTTREFSQNVLVSATPSHSWISKAEGDVSVVAGTTGDWWVENHRPFSSFTAPNRSPAMVPCLCSFCIYICHLNPRQHVSRSKALSLHLLTPYPPRGGPQSLPQTLTLPHPWSLLSGAETSHALLLLMQSLLPVVSTPWWQNLFARGTSNVPFPWILKWNHHSPFCILYEWI